MFVGLALLDFVNVLFDMTVGGEEVEPAVEIIVKEEDAEGKGLTAGRADSLADGFVAEDHGIFLRDVEGGHFVGEVADENSQTLILLEAGGVDAHCAARAAVVVEGDTGSSSDFAKGAIVGVGEDEILDSIIGDDEIHPAVVIHVDGGDPERFGHGQASGAIFDLEAGVGGGFGESALALIAIEVRVGASEVHGGTVGTSDADQFVIDFEVNIAGPLHVVTDEEVEFTIVVVVEPSGTGTPIGGVSGDTSE